MIAHSLHKLSHLLNARRRRPVGDATLRPLSISVDCIESDMALRYLQVLYLMLCFNEDVLVYAAL